MTSISGMKLSEDSTHVLASTLCYSYLTAGSIGYATLLACDSLASLHGENADTRALGRSSVLGHHGFTHEA